MRWLLLFSVLFLWFTALSASAHISGVPFLTVNGKDAAPYAVPYTPSLIPDMPYDEAPGSYTPGQLLQFVLNMKALATLGLGANVAFDWDFGDGGKTTGTSTSHVYRTAGQKTIKIFLNDGSTTTPQTFDIVGVNVLTDKNYQLPRAVINVDGEHLADPNNNVLNFDFHSKLDFDGSVSTGGTGDQLSYLWDFGDSSWDTVAKVNHKFDPKLSQAVVALRVKDTNGFISDTFVVIANTKQELPPDVTAATSPTGTPQVSGGFLSGLKNAVYGTLGPGIWVLGQVRGVMATVWHWIIGIFNRGSSGPSAEIQKKAEAGCTFDAPSNSYRSQAKHGYGTYKTKEQCLAALEYEFEHGLR